MEPDAALLRAKKTLRNALVGNAKKEVTRANELLAPEEKFDIRLVQTSQSILLDYRERISKLDSEILLLCDTDETAQAETEQSSEFDHTLLAIISKMSVYCSQPQNVSQGVSELQLGSSASSVSNKLLSVKLPKLHIEKFTGNPLKWAEFWDSFSSTGHDNDSLAEVDKFKYLRGYLDDNALRVIEGYRLTSANYEEAVSALRERFGNTQLAVFAHLEAMLGLSVSSYDISQLQSIMDQCERHIRSLVALGLGEETFGQVFTPIILSKLPPGVKMELHRKNGSDPWELSNLRKWLKEEIRAREYSVRMFSGSSAASPEDKSKSQGQSSGFRSNKQKPVGTSAALVTNDNAKEPHCSFCNENHYADQCRKFADSHSRTEEVKRTRRCFNCLSRKHGAISCDNSRPCAHCHKSGHHRSLCHTKFGAKQQSTEQSSSLVAEDQQDDQEAVSNAVQMIAQGEKAILQTALVKVKAPGGKHVAARILFDTACSRSFITSNLSTKIASRELPSEIVSIAGFGDVKRKTMKYKAVEFDVILPNGKTQTVTANVTPTISCPIQKYSLDVKDHPVVTQLQLAEPLSTKPELVQVDILLGIDHYYDFIGNEQLRLANGVIFLSSILGFIATGKIQSHSEFPDKQSTLLLTRASTIPADIMPLERFWNLEDIGMKESVTTTDDERAVKAFKESVEFKDGRYHVAWPWKDKEAELPNNYNLAIGRLKSLYKRIKDQPEVLQKYNQTIQDQLDLGIIEEVTDDEVNHTTKVHYLPHHCVITPNKATTMLRVVYDASAKASKHSLSLNECLYRGPVMLDNLCGILLRFRLHQIAMISDIEKAFLQVGLHMESRDVTRFVWFKDPSAGVYNDNLIILRFTRVMFGVISSPFLLGITIRHHCDSSELKAANDITGNTYVDNVVNGKDTPDEAISFYHEAKDLFNQANMNLREWFTNSPELRRLIAEKDGGAGEKTKVLGMSWDTVSDTMSTSSFHIQQESVTTKRHMLSNLAKVYDPCGYFAAITVTGKMLLQKLWSEKFDWDTKLPAKFIHEWSLCADNLSRISEHSFSRCLFLSSPQKNTSFSLHVFCDASAKAYGACVFLVRRDGTSVQSHLVFAKSRVAPLKEITIPKLELVAIVIAVRSLSFVAEQLRLEIHTKTVWSDSQCALHWLMKKGHSNRFVNNRVSEINSHSDVAFRYVPTEENPADLASRGCSYDELVNNKLWWKGPAWLIKIEAEWPDNPIPHSSVEDTLSLCEPILQASETTQQCEESVIDRQQFSSVIRLLRVTAWVKRFITNIQCRIKHIPALSGCVSSQELSVAQYYWELQTQKTHFTEVRASLVKNETHKMVPQLNLFMDGDGLIRCKGRFQEADIPSDSKEPILLPKNCHFTALVIMSSHIKLFHGGPSQTLAATRQRYWIVHGGSQVRSVVLKCRGCRLAHPKPYMYPKPPPLPKCRITPQKPFATTGVDYMGPLFIRSGETYQKVWLCLFTCAVVRAIHIEVVLDLSTCQFLMCLRRFMSHYTKPQLLISDNGKQFRAADRFISTIFQSAQVQDYATTEGITWKFITEMSPWMGGFYERMVGIVKKVLKSTLDRRCVTLVELQTVTIEVCSIVNSRPLTSPGTSLEDWTLTPAHFLQGPRVTVSNFTDVPNTPQNLPASYDSVILTFKRIQSMLNSYWQMWRNQYLLSLRNNFSFRNHNTSSVQPVVGEVVIVKDNLPRCQWRLGKITTLHQSSDGFVRTVSVQLSTGKVIKRATRLLFPLEVHPTKSVHSRTPEDNATDNDENVSVVSTEH